MKGKRKEREGGRVAERRQKREGDRERGCVREDERMKEGRDSEKEGGREGERNR